jgi:hypothetical protein
MKHKNTAAQHHFNHDHDREFDENDYDYPQENDDGNQEDDQEQEADQSIGCIEIEVTFNGVMKTIYINDDESAKYFPDIRDRICQLFAASVGDINLDWKQFHLAKKPATSAAKPVYENVTSGLEWQSVLSHLETFDFIPASEKNKKRKKPEQSRRLLRAVFFKPGDLGPNSGGGKKKKIMLSANNFQVF